MKLPKRLKIGPFTYRVKRTRHILSEENRALNGCIRYQSLIIEVDKGQGDQRIRETLLHEAIHGVIHDRGLEQHEDLVSSMTLGISALLIDNPKLTRLFITEAS